MNEAISWEAPEFEYHKKSADWYWILGIIVIAGALLSIMTNNTLFALFLVLAGGVVAVFGTKKPDLLQISLDRRGIRVNNQLHPHKLMDSFWVNDAVEGKEKLLLTPRSTFALQIVIPIQNVDPELVRDYMEQYVHEEEQGETIAERIMEWAKF